MLDIISESYIKDTETDNFFSNDARRIAKNVGLRMKTPEDVTLAKYIMKDIFSTCIHQLFIYLYHGFMYPVDNSNQTLSFLYPCLKQFLIVGSYDVLITPQANKYTGINHRTTGQNGCIILFSNLCLKIEFSFWKFDSKFDATNHFLRTA